MKKRNIVSVIVAFLFLGALVVMAAHSSSKNSSTEAGLTLADLVPTDSSGSTYNKKGFNDDCITYTIEDSSCVIYNLGDTYLLVEPSETDTGVCYWSILIGNSTFREPELIGISDKYLFFSVRNDSNTDKRIDIAVEIEETRGGYLNSYFHKAFTLDELSDVEKANIHAVHMLEEN